MVSDCFKGLCAYTNEQESWNFSVFYGQVRTWWGGAHGTLSHLKFNELTDKDGIDLKNSVPLTPIKLCRW